MPCVLTVYDTLTASATVEIPALVRPTTAERETELLTQLAEETEANGNFDSKRNLIATIAATLNKPNCTVASNCTAMGRQGCLRKSFTCGPCLNGYSGILTDSNTPCTWTNTSPNPTNASTPTAAYREEQKTCPNDCSDNGACYLQDKSTSKLLTSCRLEDTQCEGKCRCSNGYTGLGCELSPDKRKTNQLLRSRAVKAL